MAQGFIYIFVVVKSLHGFTFKILQKIKDTFKWFGFFFLVYPHKCVLLLFEEKRKEMTKMCRKASVALMGFEPINNQVTVRFLTIQNEVTT